MSISRHSGTTAPGPDAGVGLGNALAGTQVNDVDGEGVTGEENFISAAEAGTKAQQTVAQLRCNRRKQLDIILEMKACLIQHRRRELWEEQLQRDTGLPRGAAVEPAFLPEVIQMGAYAQGRFL